ncbi:MAG: ThiF family adenylyltransferase [Myxococcota bacterium]
MRIVFCGVGALGSTAAVACRNLDATLRLIDFDRVESKNLLAQAFVKQSVGKNKATALKLQLQNFFGVKVEAFGVRVAEANAAELLGEADLIVDCFDNAASRAVLSTYVRANDKACVHAALSADGTYGMVRWDEDFTPDAEDEEGQATCEGGEHLPFIGIVAATLARTIQEFVADGTKRDSMISLSGVQRG